MANLGLLLVHLSVWPLAVFNLLHGGSCRGPIRKHIDFLEFMHILSQSSSSSHIFNNNCRRDGTWGQRWIYLQLFQYDYLQFIVEKP
jgi:hypothetical protein